MTSEKKLLLLEKLNWDYNISLCELLKIIEGKKTETATFSKENLFAKSLETLAWEDVVNLWGMENCKTLYNEKTRKMIFPKSLVEEYDVLFGLLREHALPVSGQSSERVEKMRASFLFNRRHRSKQGIF